MMRKKLMILLSAAMLFNSFAGLASYAETQADSVSIVETEDENIKIENDTTTVAATTNECWMGEDAETADATASGYIKEASNTTGFAKISTEFCGYVFKRNQIESYVVLSDPDGAYLTELSFHMYYRKMPDGECCDISVSDTLNGPFTSVSSEMEYVGKIGNYDTRKIWKHSIKGIKAKYVKITGPTSDTETDGCYPVLGSFSYNWTKITDLSQLPDGTNKVCGTSNPYWIADDDGANALDNFVEYTVSTYSRPAKNTVTAEDIANNKKIVGNPVNEGDIAFVGVRGEKAYAYAIVEAQDCFIRSFKYYIYSVGNQKEKIAASLSVSNERNGEYAPVKVTIKELGYVAGSETNHFMYEVEAAEPINCKYVKITLPSSSTYLGAFEYDFKINKVGMALDKVFYTYNDILNGQHKMHVESDLNLFETIEVEGKQYNIEWSTTDEAIIAPDGTVHQPTKSRAVTVTAKVYDTLQSLIYSKSYDITVAPIGSTLVLVEDFEAAELDPTTGSTTVAGYNEWVATYVENTKSSISEDPSDKSNKALWVQREAAGSATEKNQRSYDNISSGKVELSFKHMYVSADESRVSWCGLTINLRQKGCYGSSIPFKNQKAVTWKKNVWHEYKFIIDLDRGLLDMYYNGEKIADTCVLPSYKTPSDIAFSSKYNYAGSTYFDDICIRYLSPEVSEAVKIDAQLLTLPERTVNDIELTTIGEFDSAIAWQSSNPEVIGNNGIVTQQAEDTDVTLHATVVNGDYIEERDITVTVLGTSHTDYVARDDASLKAIVEKFSMSEMLDGQSALNIMDDITLVSEYSKGDAGRLGGCNISWSSDSEALEINGNDGIITRGENDTKVTLTAEFSFKADSDIKTEKSYTLIISGEGEYEYHNTFDGVDFGGKASLLEGVSVTEVEDSGAFYGAWQSPTDLLNGVLGVTRAKLTSVDKDAVLATDYTGKNAEVGFSFYLSSPSDQVDVSFDGVDFPVYIKSSQVLVDGVMYDTTVTTKEWHKLVLRFDDYNKFCYAYLDGAALSEKAIEYDADFSIDSITISNDSSNGTIGVWYVDDVYIKNIDVSDEEAIRRTIEEIDIADTAEWNITLPKFGKLGARIIWSSENDTVLDGNGVVKRTVGGDKTITLTASVSRGDTVIDADFDVVVPGLTGNETPTQEKFEEHVNAIDISELTSEKYTEITRDLDLFGEYMNGNCAFYGGMDVTWSSEHTQVITDDGKVTRPMLDKGVTLTATFVSKRDTSIAAQKDFHFIVLAPYEMIHYEDFDDITEEMVGTEIDGYKNWTFEQQIQINKSMIADLEIDPEDKDKPFTDANKAFRISRWRNSNYAERARLNFTANERTAIITADVVVLSFKIKFINTKSKFDMGFGGVSGVITNASINDSGTIAGGFTSGAFAANEWHTLTFIISPSGGVIYFLIDGNKGFSEPYKPIKKALTISYLELHTKRTRGLSDYYIDDISIRTLKDSDEPAVAMASSELTLPAKITDTVTLPSFGEERTNISWISDSHDVILDSGEIVGTGDALLKAIITRGTAQAEKEFAVNVKKTGGYDFTVNNIAISDGIISGADVSYTGNASDTELIVLVYNNGRLCALRNAEITGTTVTFDNVDISEFYDCEVKAYIKKGSDIVSNVYVTNPQ